MTKMPKTKFYAVRNGRQGAEIYTSWDETKENVRRFPGAVHKSFPTLQQAQDWLRVDTKLQNTYLDGPPPDWIAQHPSASSATDLVERINSHPAAASVGESGPYHEQMVVEVPDMEELPVVEAPSINLSSEQRAVLEMVSNGKSVFFTGSAGTGKSVLLREIIELCGHGKGARHPSLAVTASTGIASVNIGGCTLHSWAGIGLGKEPKEALAGRILGQALKLKRIRAEAGGVDEIEYEDIENSTGSKAADRWQRVKTLIIDEISMIDGRLFDKLEFIARVVRRSRAPFGGIQLVLSGDFCQLPPVPDQHNGGQLESIFVFESEAWKKCIGKPVNLTNVFRQKDQAFIDMLNSMRFGRLTPLTVAKFQSLSRAVRYSDGIEPTDLFPTKREVESANSVRLNRLSNARTHIYKARDVPGYNDKGETIDLKTMNLRLERLVAPKEISLKVGAQVMLIKNLQQGVLVNGSVGKVVGFSTPEEAVKVNMRIALGEKENKLPGDRQKIPDALLRQGGVWPIVSFRGTAILCVPQDFEVNNSEGLVEARREQVPLILAWALSIHKCQGQTLERVRVNLGRIFEKGQAYVALSRATSMDTLQILNFDPGKVKAHPRVMAWMEKEMGLRLPVDDDIEDADSDEELWRTFNE